MFSLGLGLEVIKLEYSLKLKIKRNDWLLVDSHQFFILPHQNLAKSHHLSSGAKDSNINTDIREQNIYNYD